MRPTIELTSLQEAEAAIERDTILLLYLSKENCSVCHSLLPKVQEVMAAFPRIHFYHADVEQIKEMAGRFSIFTVPVLLLFVEGKEMLREARFVRINDLEEKLDKISTMYLAE
ncbi:thioredoxin family protein [Jeotgalibacillus campisalis]|uniref:Thioredoxin domain-containing protein n=1 Tax=Jeotgalibacillus campisalis TaxID=220754 RepID=A0A0C2VW07_9BACL|nr:thioredoxin family protein [Jeotgalibacillus campisalis]KIL53057.1 hypothetical protein KR50_03860 [Jeotgalibacillus campisalis]